ncbi:NYN domain-containing protein [Actinotalea sp. Marseille-Q4924]|uniref:NYN domain-containing protein n=1 Tax=Actinotalea sp. Marseille-Q4924 TaxID=2866571 RepID=UPI001CE48766|nr:NYN domain-containing protein [Actinotalea sp. Marseille-Q4924]
MTTPTRVLVVDAANVVGARPDGWWKDRVGAAERLLLGLVDAAEAPGADPELAGSRLVVVLEGRAIDAVAPERDRLEVVRAPRDGDATIVDVVAARPDDDVLVVTSDRALRERVEARGARTRGAGWLRDAVEAPSG